MKHFIFTISEKVKSGHTYKTCRLYEMIKGKPKLTATLTDVFVSEFQIAMMTLQGADVVSEDVFIPHLNGGFKYHYSDDLEKAGFCSLVQVV